MATMHPKFFLAIFLCSFITGLMADTVDDYTKSRENFEQKKQEIKNRMKNKTLSSNLQQEYSVNNNTQSVDEVTKEIEYRRRGLPSPSEIEKYYLDNGSLPPSIFEYNKKIINQLNNGNR